MLFLIPIEDTLLLITYSLSLITLITLITLIQ